MRVYLAGPHLMSVYLTGVYLTGVYLMACTSWRVPHRCAPHRRASYRVYAAVGAYLGGARLGDAYLIFVLTTLEGRLLSAKLQHLANRASAFSQRAFRPPATLFRLTHDECKASNQSAT
jgi:hypothetical protein